MNKLSSLIGPLQELASAAYTEHRSQPCMQVEALCTTSKKRQEHFTELLQLRGEYASGYLRGISDEIQQQSLFLDKLEGSLEPAKNLRGAVVKLQMLYNSETVATWEGLRTAALSRPLPEDRALFGKVDLVLTEIRQCYTELDKFWTEEMSRVIEALKKRRVDQTDFERWRSFRANLEQTIESWKVSSGDTQPLRRHDACSSKGADIGAIASSLSLAMASLTSALEELPSSNSIKCSQSGLSFIQQVYVAFSANSDLCLSLLRHCADYGEEMTAWCLPSIASPASSRVGASRDLQERTLRLRSEAADVSMENAASDQGSRKFKAAYNEALCLDRQMASELNASLERFSSWVTDTDGRVLPDDSRPDLINLERLRELWEKERHSVRVALAILKNEPAPRLASTRPKSLKDWLMNLVHFS